MAPGCRRPRADGLAAPLHRLSPDFVAPGALAGPRRGWREWARAKPSGFPRGLAGELSERSWG